MPSWSALARVVATNRAATATVSPTSATRIVRFFIGFTLLRLLADGEVTGDDGRGVEALDGFGVQGVLADCGRRDDDAPAVAGRVDRDRDRVGKARVVERE